MKEKQLKKFNVKNKIIFTTLLSVFCLFALLAVAIYFFKTNSLELEKINKIKIVAQVSANKITNDFRKYVKEAEDFNMIISNFHYISLSYREEFFKELTRKLLQGEPAAYCLWIYMDSRDSNFINTLILDNPSPNIKFFNDRKTFDVSWYRTTDNNFNVETLWIFADAMEDDYFVEPIRRKQIFVSAPYEYIYDYDNKEIPDSLKQVAWLLTFSAPAFDASRNVIGVTGMDVNLHSASEYIASTHHQLENSEMILITDSARYLYNPNEEMIGRLVVENPIFHEKDANFITQSILLSDEFDYNFRRTNNDSMFASYSLVYLPDLQLKMTVGIILPFTEIKESSYNLIRNLVLIFGCSFLLVAIVVIGLSTRFDDKYFGGDPQSMLL